LELSKKVTPPYGIDAFPGAVTLAVTVNTAPAVEVKAELVTAVEVGTPLTVTATGWEVLGS
jgi:hypothetical protein